MRKLFLILIPLALGWATTPALAQPEYVAYHEDALTSAGVALSIQAPGTTGARVVRMVRAVAYCSVACDVTLERDGTAASATALTPTPVMSQYPAALTKAYSGSDVGTGTVIGKWSLSTTVSTVVIPLDTVAIFRGTGTPNLTLRVSSITGTARLWFDFKEER
jgi:hypothetical protein